MSALAAVRKPVSGVSVRPLGAVRALCAAFVLAAAGGAGAQDYGDTPYVQTPRNVVEEMLRIARVGPGDFLIDLGSGDGRIVITAAKQYGARGFGVDLDKRLVRLSNSLAAKAGVADRAVFHARDLYETDIRRATVLSTYLLPEVNLQVRRKLIESLKPGTRIVTHDYDLGDWEPDISMVVAAPDKPVGVDRRSKVFLWKVPVRVAGDWKAAVNTREGNLEFGFALNQRFQILTGEATLNGKPARLSYGRIFGHEVNLSVLAETGKGHLRYEIRAHTAPSGAGDAIAGVLRISGYERFDEHRFQARRVAAREADFPIEEPLSAKPVPPAPVPAAKPEPVKG